MKTTVKHDGSPARTDWTFVLSEVVHELNRYDHPQQGKKHSGERMRKRNYGKKIN